MTNDPDLKLKAFLGPPDRGIDRAFVNLIDQHVLTEQRLRRARMLAWKKFVSDLAASSIVVLALLALATFWKGVGPSVPGLILGPSTLALFIFVIWAAAILKPSYSGV